MSVGDVLVGLPESLTPGSEAGTVVRWKGVLSVSAVNETVWYATPV